MKLLTAAMPDDVVVRWYDKWTALFGRYAVFHMHWPDHLLRGGGRVKVAARRLVFLSLLVRWSILRTPVVRTLHNVTPHEQVGSRVERFLLEWLDNITTDWIVMNGHSPIPDGARAFLIPHGHYREWYSERRDLNRVPKRVLSFGLVRRYKNIPGLVAAVRSVQDPEISLRVIGDCSDTQLSDEIQAGAHGDARIQVSLDHASDERLVEEIALSSLVVLPYTRLLNSGALLLALSLNRPVMIPDGDASRAYVAEFGDEWVSTYAGELAGSHIEVALRKAETLRAGDVAPLDARDWSELAAQTAAVYRAASVRRRGTNGGTLPKTNIRKRVGVE